MKYGRIHFTIHFTNMNFNAVNSLSSNSINRSGPGENWTCIPPCSPCPSPPPPSPWISPSFTPCSSPLSLLLLSLIPYSPSFSHFRQSGMWWIVWYLQWWKESEPNQLCLEPGANCYSVSQGWSKCVPCTFTYDPLNHNQNLITFLLTRTYLL